MKTDIPYKHVTRETIENMMLHIVYVASACVHEEAASLNAVSYTHLTLPTSDLV